MMATLIQKTFRGWLVRYHLPDILHEYYDRVNLNWYNRMATKIQALYKGYTVRKEICIKEILANRAKINAANAEIEKALKEQMKKNYVLRHKVHVEKIFTALFDRHHLLRTQRTEGALSTHDTQLLLIGALASFWCSEMVPQSKCMAMISIIRGSCPTHHSRFRFRALDFKFTGVLTIFPVPLWVPQSIL
ncbi:hypothetical protein NQ317_000825 [Molorchus minor]|uniref:Uncharacterized protein n=1 Tax=Molorchus minor TaxID=1323400 RepID=A0ABQ9J864_9CUCU|nr:hypothetical protein NQ317_000825 [Molorchus minor]